MNELWVVIHIHKYGSSSYLVRYPSQPTQRQVMRCLNINYEPDRNEDLLIELIQRKEAIELDWQDGDAVPVLVGESEESE